MPAGQRGPLSTRGTSGAGGGVPMQPFFDALDALDESLGMCRGRCPHRPADLPEGSDFLGQPRRNRSAEFARCSRCPPGACQRRLLPLPVSVMLIFKCFLVQVGDFISYGVCKFICLSSFMYNRFHKELRFFFSLLKRKKEAKKEKSSHFTCTVRFKYHPKIRRLHEK